MLHTPPHRERLHWCIRTANTLTHHAEHRRHDEHHLPDGYPTTTPGNGGTGTSKGTITDPTGNAATTRAPWTLLDHQLLRSARHALTLSLDIWHAAFAPRTISRQISHLRLEDLTTVTAVRLQDLWNAIHTHNIQNLHTVQTSDGPIHAGDLLEAIETHLRHCANIMHITLDPVPQRCNGGPDTETWSRPECGRLTRRLDGLCDACRQRRDHHLRQEMMA